MSQEENILNEIEEDAKVCDFCIFYTRRMDPCDDKWYGEEKMKAVCIYRAGKPKIIARGLNPYELRDIEKPNWCPKNSNGKSKY